VAGTKDAPVVGMSVGSGKLVGAGVPVSVYDGNVGADVGKSVGIVVGIDVGRVVGIGIVGYGLGLALLCDDGVPAFGGL
jgi:hypothetical protein